MNKKKIFVYGRFLCLSAILALLWATLLYGQEHNDGEYDCDEAYFLYYLQSIIDTDYMHNVEYTATDEAINFFGTHLNGDIVIAPPQQNFDVILTNVSGSGNIIISSENDGRVLLNNVNISGQVIVADSGGFVSLTLNNSNIDFIIFDGAGKVVAMPLVTGESIQPQNVTVNVPGVHMVGTFNSVESNIHNGLIFFDGYIGSFRATGNVVLMGRGDIGNIMAPAGVIVEVYNPAAGTDTHGLAEEIVSLLEGRLIYHLGRLEANLLFYLGNILEGMLVNFNFPNISIAPATAQLPQVTPVSTPRATSRPSPSPSPSPAPYIPVLTPPPSPPPTGQPGTGTPGGSAWPAPPWVEAVNINITPPSVLPAEFHLSHLGLLPTVQRTVTGDGFIGTINWFDSNGSRVTGRTFAADTRYVAQITLRPSGQRYFAENISSNIDIETGGVWYDYTNHGADVYRHDRIFISLIFDPTERVQADPFSLEDIEGPFDQVRINTHYLGRLLTTNFNVLFDGVSMTVTDVSSFNHSGDIMQGYYVLTLASTQNPNGRQRLSVQMTGALSPLSYHLPHSDPEYIYPVQVVQQDPDPELDEHIVPAGRYLAVSNFPPGADVLLSTTSLYNYEDVALALLFGWSNRAVLLEATGDLPQRIEIPSYIAPRHYSVWIIDSATKTTRYIGTIDVTPPISGTSLLDPILLGIDLVEEHLE